MNNINLILYVIILSYLTACGNSAQEHKKVEQESVTTTVVKEETAAKPILINFSFKDVARFTISSIMNQPSKNIKVSEKDGLYILSYIRKSDSQKFDYKIKFEGNNVIWASIDGRWRDASYDERISFEEGIDNLKIIQTFSDGSVDTKEYQKGD
ncbi:hypothetical protein [Sphingobacterium luzhongxinii]|uniref:hypothetical protein n=1 Tax=Sphingobacterium luzhongxinii TaxID=2654181 RepID=UPI0013DD1AC2|nr:hypothetical protein [Sphingobacterium sp. xlx-73]